MGDELALAEWMKRGSQKAAIFRVMTRPMPPIQLLELARMRNPAITMRDLWGVLHSGIDAGVTQCLTPSLPQSRIYYPTDLGRRALDRAFGLQVPPLPDGVNWERTAYVLSGSARTRVFLEVQSTDGHPRRATDIKTALRSRAGITLNQSIRALNELEHAGLVKLDGLTDRRQSRLYAYTSTGRRIVDVLRYYRSRDALAYTERGDGERNGETQIITDAGTYSAGSTRHQHEGGSSH